MPAGLIFHEGNAFALDCISDDHGRYASGRFGCLDGLLDGLEIMTVDDQHLPTKGGKFLIDRLW